MGALNKFLVRARTLRSTAASKAAKLAKKSSTNLSRIAFIGLIALAFMSSTVSMRVAGPRLTANIEIVRTRPIPTQTTPSSSASDSKAAPTPSPPEAALQPVKPAKPLPPSAQPAPPWTDSEVAAARAQCKQLLDKVTLVADNLEPTREGICGAPAPRILRSLGESKVRIDPPAALDCPMIAAINTWLSDKLQPAAQKSFGSPVVRILAEGAYSCRNRYGLANAPISEHAFMNAIDIAGFVLANGKVIKVSHSWRPPPHDLQGSLPAKPQSSGRNLKVLAVADSTLRVSALAKQSEVKSKTPAPSGAEKDKAAKELASAFLHRIHDDACSIFGTVLGPDANAAHHDHFHLDMKARKYRSICE